MSWIREANSEPIPGYRLIEPIGSGGFGEVWKCEAPGGLYKAVKFVYGNLRSADIDCVRAEQEYRALQRVKEVRHPFICSLELIREIEGELMIVMELADRTLHDMCQDCISAGMVGIPRDDLMRYLRDAAEALDYMNERHSLQHLDVKPKNLFLIGDRVKVADFGLVKNLERQASGMLGGVTPLYASPETFQGKISAHSDQYSLAIVYMEMLTGQRPFAAKNVRQLAQAHMQEDPDLRPLPEAERPAIGKALAKDPQKRYPNCMAFVSALYKARKALRVTAPETPIELPGAVFGTKMRSRSLAETMEDMSLDEMESIQGVPAAKFLRPPVSSDSDVDFAAAEADHADLGMTVPQPDTGALRPTLIIGVGAFGCKALLEMRCRLLDRFGDLSKLPVIRFVHVDSDPQAASSAVRGAPQVAMTRNELYQLPLQPVGSYRKRNLEHLCEWLPREKLYSMSRSLQTQGSRALGRLAYTDNHARLAGRLKREFQEITHPDRIYEAVTQTGLALRDSTPRVYVLCAAGGGASGMLPDLGYAIQRTLRQLGHRDAAVHLMLLCGAPMDPATSKHELANLYATLTELNHFADDTASFSAQYGPDAQRLVDQGAPFTSTYLLPMEHRTPEAFDETVAHLGNFLFHELTTPLGLRMDIRRTAQNDAGHGASFRSFGTFAVWFPRGLLLHQAARQACRHILAHWISNDSNQLDDDAYAAIEQQVKQAVTLPEFLGERLIHQIERNAAQGVADKMQTPGETLASMLAKFEEQLHQPLAQDDPTNWAKQALVRIKEYLGAGEGDGAIGEWRKTKLTRTLMVAAGKTADDWAARCIHNLGNLLDHPGPRLLAAEIALGHVQTWLQQEVQKHIEAIEQHATRSLQQWNRVEAAILECVGGGGFRLFAGRSKSRQLRAFVDQLSHFSRSRLQEELAHAAKQALLNMASKLSDQARDLGFCRQRLRHLMENLEFVHGGEDDDTLMGDSGHQTPEASPDAFWEVIRQSATARVVLPEGETDLERCAQRMLGNIHPDQWRQIELDLSERVLNPRGGLHNACINTADLTKHLALPMLNEAAALLSEHLPTMDVAEILGAEWSAQGSEDPHATQAWMREYLDRATPALFSQTDGGDQSFLLVPASAAGGELAAKAAVIAPDLELVRVPGQGDLMFLREEGKIEARDLDRWLKPARAAYEAIAHSPSVSPHARFDLQDWAPLNP